MKPLRDTPVIGETRPAGWFVDKTTYTLASGWKLVEFRRCYSYGPHKPMMGQRWKPVWRYIR